MDLDFDKDGSFCLEQLRPAFEMFIKESGSAASNNNLQFFVQYQSFFSKCSLNCLLAAVRIGETKLETPRHVEGDRFAYYHIPAQHKQRDDNICILVKALLATRHLASMVAAGNFLAEVCLSNLDQDNVPVAILEGAVELIDAVIISDEVSRANNAHQSFAYMGRIPTEPLEDGIKNLIGCLDLLGRWEHAEIRIEKFHKNYPKFLCGVWLYLDVLEEHEGAQAALDYLNKTYSKDMIQKSRNLLERKSKLEQACKKKSDATDDFGGPGIEL